MNWEPIEASGVIVEPLNDSDQAADFLHLLNARPGYANLSTLGQKQNFDIADAEMFLWRSQMEDSSTLLTLRSPSSHHLMGAISILVPHPKENEPWIGVFLRSGPDTETAYKAAIDAVSGYLRQHGWTHLFVSPLAASPLDELSWWQQHGFAPVRSASDNNEREVIVMSRKLD